MGRYSPGTNEFNQAAMRKRQQDIRDNKGTEKLFTSAKYGRSQWYQVYWWQEAATAFMLELQDRYKYLKRRPL